MRNNHSAPVPTPFTISITCTAEACVIVGQQGQMAQQFTLDLDDAEAHAREGRGGAQPDPLGLEHPGVEVVVSTFVEVEAALLDSEGDPEDELDEALLAIVKFAVLEQDASEEGLRTLLAKAYKKTQEKINAGEWG